MPALSDYLAQKYLTASNSTDVDPSDARPAKKRKKNKDTSKATTNSLLIADDDDGLLLSTSGSKSRNEDNEENGPTMYDTKVRSAEFRKSKKNAWQTLDGGDDKQRSRNNGDRNEREPEDDADTLLRQTMASDARIKAEREFEDAPAVVDTANDGDEPSSMGPRMESGVRAGLQTAADTARLVAEQEAREAAEAEAEAKRRRQKKKAGRAGQDGEDDTDGKPREHEETIYRDATGRRIDLTLRRQEARKAEQERLAAEKKARDSALGEVQLQQRQERKQELEDAQFLTIGRSVDDEEMNSQLKQEMRWNDPMARYMASKQAQTRSNHDQDDSPDEGRGAGGKRRGVPARMMKEYAGASAPNRYGIKAGWRWDGVDRGNGFENQWFQARGRKARNENLEYMWQMDE